SLPRLEALAAVLDKFAIVAAEPGNRNLASGTEDREQFRPLSLVAKEAPGLNALCAGIFVVHVHTVANSSSFPGSERSGSPRIPVPQLMWHGIYSIARSLAMSGEGRDRQGAQ